MKDVLKITTYNRIFFMILCCCLLIGCGNQPKQFGSKPYDLKEFDFDIDIPTFYGDEQLFTSKLDIGLSTYEEEIALGRDSVIPYIQYEVTGMSSDNIIYLAKYRNIMFEALNMVVDEEEKNVNVVIAEREEMPRNKIEKLIDYLDKDYPNATINLEEVEKSSKLRLIWRNDKTVVQLVVDAPNTIKMSEDYHENYREFGEVSYNEEPNLEDSVQLSDKQKIIAKFKEVISRKDKEYVYLILSTKEFDDLFRDSYYSSTRGSMTYYR